MRKESTFRLRLSSIVFVIATIAATGHAPTSGQQNNPNQKKQLKLPDAAAKKHAKELLEAARRLSEKATSREEYKAAQERFEEAAELYQKLGDRSGECEALLQIAEILHRQDYHRESLPFAERALELARRTGDRRREARALSTAGVASYWIQQYQKALSYQEQALEVSRRLEDKGGQGQAMANLGLIYREMGQDEKGVSSYEKAIPLIRAAGDRRREAPVMTNLSIYYAQQGDLEKAFEGFARVHEISLETGDRQNEALGLLNMGNVRMDQKRYEQAIAFFLQALDVQKASGIQRRQISTLKSLGAAHEQLGKLEAALQYFQQAQDISDTIGNYRTVFDMRLVIAKLQHRLGRTAVVRAGLEKTIREMEQVYRTLRADEFRTGTNLRHQAIYHEAIDLLSEMGDYSTAFHVVERAHARALLDLLAESRAEIRRGVDDELLVEQQAILRRASALRNELLNGRLSQERRRELEATLSSEEDKFEKTTRKIQRLNPRYASIRYPQPYDLQRVQREVLALGETLLEFALGESRSFVWLITRTEQEFRVLPGKADIEKQIEPFLQLINTRPNSLELATILESVRERGSRLAKTLLGDLAGKVTAAQHLIIVPDGPLYYLPFEALWMSHGMEGYLIEDVDVSYSPSATVWGELKRRKLPVPSTRLELLAFADPLSAVTQPMKNKPGTPSARSENLAGTPVAELERSGFRFEPLPMAQQEVRGLEDLLGPEKCKVFIGADATKERLTTSDLRRFRRVHFATHGVIDEQIPKRSGLVLASTSGGGGIALLQMSEIFNLDLNAELVVLSACQTGLGKLVQGEGVMGLTRAFLYAGTQNVVVSLWNVSDVSTATLMGRFYREMVKGRPVSSALRQAKLNLIGGSNPMERHPYFWAPFVTVGQN